MENAELFWLIRVGFSFSPAGDNWGFLNGRKQDWLTFDQLGQADKGYIRLDESESVANIRIALVALKRGLPPGETDAMLVYDANSLRLRQRRLLARHSPTLPRRPVSPCILRRMRRRRRLSGRHARLFLHKRNAQH